MLQFKINPLVRAVGTVGAVAALVGGITFAAQTSNTVKLTANTLTAATATLALAGGTCPSTGSVTGTTATGMTFNNLAPGVESSPAFTFCLSNTGSVALDVTMTSPTDLSASTITPSDVTLNITCGSTTTHTTLDNLSTGAVVDTGLAAGANAQCSATATLSNSFSGNGGNVTPFELDFAGATSSV
jgi:hypothetical protein